LPSCSASDSSHQGPDASADGRVVDAPRTVPEGRPEVDHRVELQPVIFGNSRVEVDPPEVLLGRPALEEFCLLVGVHVRVEHEQAAAEVDHRLHHVAETARRHHAEVVHRDRVGFVYGPHCSSPRSYP
jgi:hypothetical protein